jgi:hypothetical protein
MKINGIFASTIALFAASPAFAFDTITWNWDANAVSTVVTAATSDIAVTPTGLEQIETDQSALGDFAAISTTLGVANNVLGSLSGVALNDIVAVETTASALANSASLTSDVSMQFDSSQSYGGVDLTVLGGLTGGLADVSLPGVLAATATTTGVINGTVDSGATAVANNLTANLVTTSGEDAFAIGNSTQNAFALTTATSLVDTVAFTDVLDLGTLVNPGVSSVSTAVGNNLGVTIDGIN